VDTLLNLLAGAYLNALEAGARSLTLYAIPILSVAAIAQWHREWWGVVLSGGSQIGDALGHLLFMVVTTGFYLWLLVHLWEIGQAAFDTFAQWGMLGSGHGLTTDQLRNPGFILERGLKLAFPVADQASFLEKAWKAVGLVVSPKEWGMALAIVLAFLAIAVHHLFLLVEFYMALMCGHVLIGWGMWKVTAHFAEFSLGWITGALIRTLVSCTIIGISIPLFDLIRQVPTAGSPFEVMTYVNNVTPVVGSLVFAVLAWVLPARAARMAGGASLGLTGSTIASSAMTLTRFGTMTYGAIRGTSQLMRRAAA
jgi:P-type conjugative transfer protein TrbL